MNYTIIIPDKGQIIHCRNYRSAVNLVNEFRCGVIIRNDNPIRAALERDIRRQWSTGKEVENV